MQLPDNLRFSNGEHKQATDARPNETRPFIKPVIRRTGEVAVRFGCEGCIFGRTVTYPTADGALNTPANLPFPTQVTVEHHVNIEGPFSAHIPAGRYSVNIGAEQCGTEPLYCTYANEITAAADHFSAHPGILNRQVAPPVQEIPVNLVYETPTDS